jgi:hypothetical protein
MLMATAGKRKVCGRAAGFYKSLAENVDDDSEVLRQGEAGDCLVLGEELKEDEYSVERVVEKRKGNSGDEYLVLWEGYRREESSWVKREDLTAVALRLKLIS